MFIVLSCSKYSRKSIGESKQTRFSLVVKKKVLIESKLDCQAVTILSYSFFFYVRYIPSKHESVGTLDKEGDKEGSCDGLELSLGDFDGFMLGWLDEDGDDDG